MRKLLPLLVLAIALPALTASKWFPSRAEMNDEAAAKATDQVMVKAFWPNPFGRERTSSQEWETRIYEDLIQEQHTNYLYAQSMPAFYEKMASADSSKDEIAQKYIETAKARGNVVKLYKSPINTAITKLFGDPDDTPKVIATVTSSDPALIEYTPEGRMVSALVRVAKAASNMATIQRHYFSRIYLDPAIRTIENRLSNRELEDQLLAVQ